MLYYIIGAALYLPGAWLAVKFFQGAAKLRGEDDGQMLRPCTLWYRLDDAQGWVFNHMHYGRTDAPKPEPRYPAQEWWKNATWKREDAFMRIVAPRVIRED